LASSPASLLRVTDNDNVSDGDRVTRVNVPKRERETLGGGIAGLRRRGLSAKRDEEAVGCGLWMVGGCASQQSNSDDLLEPRRDLTWKGVLLVGIAVLALKDHGNSQTENGKAAV